MEEAKREVWLLAAADQIVTGVHPEAWCSGPCVVHNPSNHSLRQLPLRFDVTKKAFYRVCEHAEHHQDPDERSYWTNQLERGVKKARVASGGKSLEVLAMEKLADWACPLCVCGCCDITST